MGKRFGAVQVQVTRVWVPAGSRRNSFWLWERKGLTQSAVAVSDLDGWEAVMAIWPSPELPLPVQLEMAPRPLADPL